MPSADRCTSGSSTFPGCSAGTARVPQLPGSAAGPGARRPDRALPRPSSGEPFVHRRAVLLPRRQRQRRLARRHDRPQPVGRTPWWRSSRSAPPGGCRCARADGGVAAIGFNLGPRRPDRDGRLVPAHLGARHPEDRQAGGAADQRAVPPAGSSLRLGRARGRVSQPLAQVDRVVVAGEEAEARVRRRTASTGRARSRPAEAARSTRRRRPHRPPWRWTRGGRAASARSPAPALRRIDVHPLDLGRPQRAHARPTGSTHRQPPMATATPSR